MLDNLPGQSTIDCNQVDIDQIEQAGTAIINNIQEMVLNIDLRDAQFDIDKLYEEAQKIGVDVGDLSDYGFDPNSPSCGGKTCFRPDQFKNIDDLMSRGNSL